MAEATTTPTYQPDPRLAQARDVIAKKLGLSTNDVTVKVGRDKKSDNDHISFVDRVRSNDSTEDLIITIHKEGLSLERPRLAEEIRTALATLQPLADNVQMEPEEKQVEKLLADLKAATAGTNFNPKLLEWPGFKPEVLTNGWEISDYAAQNIENNAYGVTMNLHFSHAKDENPAAAIERFSEITKGRLVGIKEILLARVTKYARANITERGLNEQEAQIAKAAGPTPEAGIAKALEEKIQKAELKIREDLGKLIIAVNTQDDNLVVTMRSPEQAAAYEKTDTFARWQEPTNADDLRNTNPLTSRIIGLTTMSTPATDKKPEVQPQLHKALARSFLFDKDKNTAPDALQIFGRNDIKAALIKEIVLRVIPKNPEKKDVLEKLLNSELFKNQGSWHNAPGKVGMSKVSPQLNPLGNDTLEMSLSLTIDKDPAKNQLLQVVDGLAKLATATAPTVPVAAAKPAEVTLTAEAATDKDDAAATAKPVPTKVEVGTVTSPADPALLEAVNKAVNAATAVNLVVNSR